MLQLPATERFETAIEDKARDEIAAEVMHEMKKESFIFVYKEENVLKNMETEEVRKKVRE